MRDSCDGSIECDNGHCKYNAEENVGGPYRPVHVQYCMIEPEDVFMSFVLGSDKSILKCTEFKPKNGKEEK